MARLGCYKIKSDSYATLMCISTKLIRNCDLSYCTIIRCKLQRLIDGTTVVPVKLKIKMCTLHAIQCG